ncbi:F-box protein At1g52495 [Lactuca sativa]|nr:F-box protein At1g52495 [Lactuca sativa]
MSSYLCEELIVEIFTRLPSKSLLRFRSLSQSFYSIICSTDFIRMHTFRSPQKLLLKHRNHYKNEDIENFYTLHSEDQLASCTSGRYISITPNHFPYNRYSYIVGSCNGILCLCDYLKENHVSLWNPSIRRNLNLADCPLRGSRIGFGFDPITDDYKIVSIPRYGGHALGIAQSSFVYAMKRSANWRKIAFHASSSAYKVLPSACFVNGALHWVVVERDSNNVKRFYILTFDLSTDVFGRISLPEPSWEKRRVTTIQGSLAVISTKGDKSWIWIRRDASWSVVYKLKKNKVGNVMEVLQLNNNCDLLLRTYSARLRVYNPKTGAGSRLVDFKPASYVDDIVLFVERFQLLDRGIPDLS